MSAFFMEHVREAEIKRSTAKLRLIQPEPIPPNLCLLEQPELRKDGAPCRTTNSTTTTPFTPMRKRRRGFPSETKVKRGVRIVHGDKLLEEKLGRNDLCPCGSGKVFKRCCLKSGRF